ncbi:MAG: hypothetical protein H6737_17050 [Alphaproteobacteria bacterium]|nr:hypothetical protein [Alphaproteobacteria bacterium]
MALSVHVAVGALALIAFWSALAAKKGSRLHRAIGRGFFVAMLLVVATVGPLVVDPKGVDPGRVVQMAYLSACVGTVVFVGWSSVRLRRAPERFYGLHLRGLGALVAGLGAIVLVAGLTTSDPVPAVLSWVGLLYGAALVRLGGAGPRSGTWWLGWHLDAVCGLLTAVHGTLLYVLWRGAVDPLAGRATAAAFHVAVLVVAVALRHHLARRYRAPSLVFPLRGTARQDRPSPGA